MKTPINTLVSDMVNILDDRLREDFEERAAIMEFDAELSRAHAECLALPCWIYYSVILQCCTA